MSRLERILLRLVGAGVVYFAAHAVIAGAWAPAVLLTVTASGTFALARRPNRTSDGGY